MSTAHLVDWADTVRIMQREPTLFHLQPVSSSALSGRLPSVLYKLTESETPDVCFPAVVVLSHLKAEQGYCIEKLTLALDHPNPHYQSLVSVRWHFYLHQFGPNRVGSYAAPLLP